MSDKWAKLLKEYEAAMSKSLSIKTKDIFNAANQKPDELTDYYKIPPFKYYYLKDGQWLTTSTDETDCEHAPKVEAVSACEHQWVQQQLFTSFFTVCKKCKKEPGK